MIIRLLPNSPAVNALCICHERKRLYRHNGQEYMVEQVSVIGDGQSARVVAELKSPFDVLEDKQY
ncbi:hypothetical protein C9980_25265 [Vibrio mediterranei]|uniref:hypothetical protein n=1 Tax=Vibrio mediterranei TaxID=689 RepID=UPI000D185192|nr:hypothetical protein [Vibrio mediterranei]PTC02010.1 hypothetical protein C9980_25265 [Vibrio mediterranei]